MAIENAISDLKTALDGDDKEAIEKKTAALGEASGSLAQKLYAEQAAQGAEGAEGETGSADDDVARAHYEEHFAEEFQRTVPVDTYMAGRGGLRTLLLAALVVLTGEIMRMPGLPKKPLAESVRFHPDGSVEGLG